MNEPPARPLRIGVNALYLIPGRVGGTEIYLRSLLQALAEIDKTHRYFVFMNRETGPELVPPAENWVAAPLDVRAVNRPARILCEQTELPSQPLRHGVAGLFNPGFPRPMFAPFPSRPPLHHFHAHPPPAPT